MSAVRRGCSVLGVGLGLVLGCSTPGASIPAPDSGDPLATTPTSESPPVSEPSPLPAPAAHVLGLDDDSLYGDPLDELDAVQDKLADEGFEGLRIDAPLHVDLEARDRLPIVGIHGRQESADQRTDRDRHALVVLVNLATGELQVSQALATAKGTHAKSPAPAGKMPAKSPAPQGKMPAKSPAPQGKMPAKSPAPQGKDGAKAATTGDAHRTSLFEFDARAVLDLAWEPGRYRLALVLAEHISNWVEIELGDGGTSPQPLAAASLSEVDLGASERSPSLEGPGLALALPASAVSEPGASLPLAGTLRYPGQSEALVHVLATSDTVSGPFTVSVRVALDGDGLGYFNLDWIASEGLPKRPARWYVYALAGPLASEATVLELTPGKPW